MEIIIEKPVSLDTGLITQLVELIVLGDQVPRQFIIRGISSSDLIALLVENKQIISSATLKNPLKSYRESVFQQAKVEDSILDDFKELGYIVTHPEYEGKKLCQILLAEFFKIISEQQMFATTRKPSMVHILKKFGFHKIGENYKKDLELLIYTRKK